MQALAKEKPYCIGTHRASQDPPRHREKKHSPRAQSSIAQVSSWKSKVSELRSSSVRLRRMREGRKLPADRFCFVRRASLRVSANSNSLGNSAVASNGFRWVPRFSSFEMMGKSLDETRPISASMRVHLTLGALLQESSLTTSNSLLSDAEEAIRDFAEMAARGRREGSLLYSCRSHLPGTKGVRASR